MHDSKRDALISLMQRWYHEIYDIELAHEILAEDMDMRPRIEQFHDAVRVLTSQPDAEYDPSSRLSVEQLAYDLASLRYIQDNPLASRHGARRMQQQQPTRMERMREATTTMPARFRTDVNPHVRRPHEQQGEAEQKRLGGSTGAGDNASKKLPPHRLRSELIERYKNYTIFFAALFGEVIDNNYQSRVTVMDGEVHDLAQIEEMLKAAERGEIPVSTVEDAINYLENEALREQLLAVLKRQKARAQQTIATIRNHITNVDQQIAAMDKAHMNYLAGQMILYQDGKELVKKLAAQGLNLAGQYLETSIQRGMDQSRGSGMGRGL